MPTRWFLLVVLAVLLAAGIVVGRGPHRSDGPSPGSDSSPARMSPPDSASSPRRFRFEDLTGHPAPDFSLIDLRGRRHGLAAYRGRVVMLVFWATWCKTCPVELPHLARIAHALGPKKLVTLSINWEKDARGVTKMARDTDFDFPILQDLDERVRYAYDAFTVPRVIIVDRTGKIARVIRGYEGEASPIVQALADQGLILPASLRLVRPVPVERLPLPARR